MAISITNITRPGANLQVGNNPQIRAAPAATNPMALHIEEYTGVVEGMIARHAIMHDYIPVRAVRGTAPDATVNQAAKIKLTVDTVVLARSSYPLIDEFQNSYDARSHIAEEHGKEIAKFYDQAFLIQAVKTAGISNMATYPEGWKPGTVKTFATAGLENDPAALEDYLGQVFVDMEEKDIDPIAENLVVVMRPRAYNRLFKNDRLIDRTLITSDGNSIATKHLAVYGVPIRVSNNLPNTNVTNHRLSNAGNNNAYNGDFTKTVAAVFSPRALLAGESIPLTTKVFFDDITKMWFIDAFLSFGVTANNPAFAGVLKAK